MGNLFENRRRTKVDEGGRRMTNLDFSICLKDTLANCMCDKCWCENVGDDSQ